MDTDKGNGDDFVLTSGTDLFTTRSKDVFAGLAALEEKHEAFLKTSSDDDASSLLKDDPDEDNNVPMQTTRDLQERSKRHGGLSSTVGSDYERKRSHSHDRKRDGDRRRDRETDSSENRKNTDFKRPHKPHFRGGWRKSQPMPDYKKNPDKWTMYSLSDVSEKDMSEKSNTRAALAFLEERRIEKLKAERRLAGLDDDEEKFDAGGAACSKGVIAFSRRAPNKTDDKSSNKVTGASSKSHVQENIVDSFDKEEGVAAHRKDAGEEDDEVLRDKSVERTAIGSCSTTFKSRKNVKRVIRRKENDSGDELD